MASDSRILHVSKKYANQYSQADVYAELSQAHKTMRQQFLHIAKGKGHTGAGSRREAAELQDFFQLVKDASASKFVLDSIEDATIRGVIGTIVDVSLKTSDTHSGKLFRYVADSIDDISNQGARFEKQLNAVIASTLSLSYGDKYGKNIKSAMGKIGLGNISVAIDKATQTALQEAGEAVLEETEGTNKATFSKYVLIEKSGKIDSSGMMYKGEITASPTSYLYRIASLLQKANFTAKSYTSMREQYIKSINLTITKKTQSASLTLGSTESARVLFTVLKQHMPAPVALSAYYYIMNTSSNSVKVMASRMRFIYELTGYGQQYQDTFIQNILGANGSALRANYIIYNDPGSMDIYVRSTADIITELWNEIDNLLTKKEIELSKMLFKS